jgi:hypothetical protein
MPVAVRFRRGKGIADISFRRDVSDLSVMMALFAFEAHQERGNRALERNPLLRKVFGKSEVVVGIGFRDAHAHRGRCGEAPRGLSGHGVLDPGV